MSQRVCLFTCKINSQLTTCNCAAWCCVFPHFNFNDPQHDQHISKGIERTMSKLHLEMNPAVIRLFLGGLIGLKSSHDSLPQAEQQHSNFNVLSTESLWSTL